MKIERYFLCKLAEAVKGLHCEDIYGPVSGRVAAFIDAALEDEGLVDDIVSSFGPSEFSPHRLYYLETWETFNGGNVGIGYAWHRWRDSRKRGIGGRWDITLP